MSHVYLVQLVQRWSPLELLAPFKNVAKKHLNKNYTVDGVFLANTFAFIIINIHQQENMTPSHPNGTEDSVVDFNHAPYITHCLKVLDRS